MINTEEMERKIIIVMQYAAPHGVNLVIATAICNGIVYWRVKEIKVSRNINTPIYDS